MGRSYSRQLVYKDTGDFDRLKIFSGITNIKIQPAGSAYPSGAIELTETGVGTGIYKNDDVGDGLYKLYINDVYRSEYGVFWVGDDELPYAKLAGGNSFSGNQEFADDVNVGKQVNVVLDVIARELFVNASGNPFLTNSPSFGSSLVWLSYLESRLSAIVLSPYQESVNRVRCIVGGVVETNKVYTSPKTAAGHFAAPSVTNQCLVDIVGTGALSQYVNFDLTTLRDYVHWKAAGKHINCIIRDGATNAKICTFQNCTLFFGANDYASDRSYANKTFIDCDIYCYRNMTFNNCTLIRCRIIHASTYKAFISGASRVEMTGFNNDPSYDLVGGYKVLTYKIEITSMPPDPSTPEIPS